MLFVKTKEGGIVNLAHVRSIDLSKCSGPDGTEVVAKIAPSGGTSTESLSKTLFSAYASKTPNHEAMAQKYLSNLAAAMERNGTAINPLPEGTE